MILDRVDVDPGLEENAGLFGLAGSCGQGESVPALLLSVVDVAVDADEELDRLDAGVADGVLEDAPPVLVHRSQVAALLQDEPEANQISNISTSS